ncbi:Importin subunit beta-1 [Galemys pyrenaicus]|uniref:Importin subunit beta-1 n=1 Tax=Galemys pyrenaicus TaxID=202257 RepID=A0A8J6DQJ2_GALPY|nr:Importin subunit beta-1 [Galemys pyrenaicus]
MKSDSDEMVVQESDFWPNVFDEEIDSTTEVSEGTEQGQLLSTQESILTKQDENDDNDNRKPCKAAWVCCMKMKLSLVSSPSVKNTPRALVVELQCGTYAHLKALTVVFHDTAAWTIGRVCELLLETVINYIYLIPLMQCLIEILSAEPKVASNVLAEASDQEEPATYCLSCFEQTNLLDQMDRPNKCQNNPRTHWLESSSVTFTFYPEQFFRTFSRKCNIKMLFRSLCSWPPVKDTLKHIWLMLLLLVNLGNNVPSAVKSHILAVFGDISLDIEDFKKYVDIVLNRLLVDLPRGQSKIYSFIDHIATTKDQRDGVVACAAGVIGDLRTLFRRIY